ncbi:MAG: hypothetical protein IPM61_12835 [Chlorobi bacterium]|nr:hypothetical protein [Chlorobiota bacterium]MBX7215920.1 hypothetical protein [Candidatus Kapabacteria bacterium]
MATESLSRILWIGTIVLFLFYLLIGGLPFSAPVVANIVLAPVDISDQYQLWRLLSYPLGPSFIGLLLAGIAFGAPGEEVESILGKRSFGVALLWLTLAIGVLHVLGNWGESAYALSGLEHLALFTIVGFVYLFPQSSVRIFFINIPSWFVLTFACGLVLIQTVDAVVEGGHGAGALFTEGVVTLVASAGFFHARFQKYRFLLGAIRTFERVAFRPQHSGGNVRAAGGAMQPMPMRHVASRAFAGRLQPQHPVRRQELSDEERLNQILDQISETGYDSLSPDEQRFLREYSQRL